jgi:ATP-dependent Clp protease ATP-binding subunit ClpC
METLREFYFEEPLLKMSAFSRKLVTYLATVWIIILTAAAALFIISGINRLFWPGLLIALYLGHRLLHLNHARFVLGNLPAKGRINTSHYLNQRALNVLTSAFDKCLMAGGDFNLFLAKECLHFKEVREIILRMDIDYLELEQKLNESWKKSLEEKTNKREEIYSQVGSLVLEAISVSLRSGGQEVDVVDLFPALAAVGSEPLLRVFSLFNIEPGDLEKALVFGKFSRFWFNWIPTSLGGFASQPYRLRHRTMNRAWTARPTPILDSFSFDLTDMARAGLVGFLIGHKQEYDRLVDILSRPNKPNALLIGEAGSGKETIVGHLAYEIIHDRVPPQLFDKRLIALDLNALLAGADLGEQQARVKAIFEEIAKAGNIILYVPDIHNLSRTAGRYELNIINTILPLILSNDFPTIGSTYPKEAKQFIENQSSFADAFQFIQVQELTPAEAEIVLIYNSLILEKQYRVKITYGAVKQAVAIAAKYFRQRLLPGSADDLLKEALAEAARRGDKVISAEDIIAAAEKRINVPLHKAKTEEREKLLRLEELIHERLVDQEAAVSSVAKALREYRSGLVATSGPIGSFLFVGPTGVGKTELSKVLARIQFGSEEMMIRFDMSEYQDKSSYYRFIGSPDGELPGALTEAVLQKPYSLILLDEFEKAHPDVLNLFLQVFDEGRLTDNVGRTVDFRNTIVIATSNAESEFIKESLDRGSDMAAIVSELKKRLTHYFRPELLNRLQLVVFKSLGVTELRRIARLLLDDLSRTLEKQGIKMTVEEAALEKIVELGFSPSFGARPLKGVIADTIKAPLSEMLLKGEIGRGGDILIILEKDEIKVKSNSRL